MIQHKRLRYVLNVINLFHKYCRNCFGEIKVSDIYEDTFWCDTCGTNPLSELKTIDELCNEEDNAIEVCDICTEVIEEDDTRHYVKGKVYCSVCYRLFGKDEEKYTTPLKYKVYKKCPHCNKEGGNNAMKYWHFDKCKFKS